MELKVKEGERGGWMDNSERRRMTIIMVTRVMMD
jgi:hypothetical protein